MTSSPPVPLRGWIVTFAGMAVNLCLGILYAWSVWKKKLIGDKGLHPPGSAMGGLDDGWNYLTDFEGTLAYSLCGLIFALAMIPGGRLQDRYDPRLGVTLSSLLLGGGCILAGLMKSYFGLILGFGLLGGIGMGLGYAAATPAAVKWFGPQRRGLIVGLVVGGYGGAAIYIAPLAEYLIAHYGLSGSFIGLGCLFAVIVMSAGQLLVPPPPGYAPPTVSTLATSKMTAIDWKPREMLKTWQFFAVVFLFIGTAQSGLLVIANATPILNSTAKELAFFAANAWLLAAFGGFVNASGRVGTGLYSDRIGRANAFRINGIASAICLLLMPWLIGEGNVIGLFVAVGVVYWQYGGGLALMPAFTADFFGAKNLGFNYGLVFLGWGIAFLVPQSAGYIKDFTGSLDAAFYFSAGLLLAAVIVSWLLKPPTQA